MATNRMVTYHYAEAQDIHEFTFGEFSQWSIDMYIELLQEIYDEHQQHEGNIKTVIHSQQATDLTTEYASAFLEETFNELDLLCHIHIEYMSEHKSIQLSIDSVDSLASLNSKGVNYYSEDQILDWATPIAV